MTNFSPKYIGNQNQGPKLAPGRDFIEFFSLESVKFREFLVSTAFPYLSHASRRIPGKTWPIVPHKTRKRYAELRSL